MSEKYDLNHFDINLLKKMSYDEEKELAEEIRNKIISVVSLNGGHLSSNLGVVDLTISLLNSFDAEKDDILFDVGHQTYTYKILTGRDISSIRLNDGLASFQSLKESKYDKYEAGHSSTSISVGLGMAAAKKMNNNPSQTVIVIGDGAIANGLAFEALNNLDYKKNGKLIIVINDNNMSISKPKGAVSILLNSLRTSMFYQSGANIYKKIFDNKYLRWLYISGKACKDLIKRIFIKQDFFSNFDANYLGPIDGHDIKKMDKFFKRAQQIDNSVIIHIKTTKGKGFPLAEIDENGYWHGASPFNIETGQPSNMHEDYISFSHIAGNEILHMMDKDDKAVLIVPAMIKGSHLEEVFVKYPSRCFDVGIAEEHAITFAAGLGLKGLHPIISIYSTFLQRAYDELLHDLSRMEIPSLIILDRVGLIGPDGSSHQGIFDIDYILGIPNTSIYCPFDGESLISTINNYSFATKGPTIIRVERELEKKNNISLTNNKDMKDYICSYNSYKNKIVIGLGKEMSSIIDKIKGEYNYIVLNKIKDFPKDLIEILLNQVEINIYDATSTKIGFASYLSLILTENGYKGTLNTYCLPNEFIDKGNKLNQLQRYSLDPQSVVKKLLSK